MVADENGGIVRTASTATLLTSDGKLGLVFANVAKISSDSSNHWESGLTASICLTTSSMVPLKVRVSPLGSKVVVKERGITMV